MCGAALARASTPPVPRTELPSPRRAPFAAEAPSPEAGAVTAKPACDHDDDDDDDAGSVVEDEGGADVWFDSSGAGIVREGRELEAVEALDA